MVDTVFWSWQDDLPSKVNRDFLREALAIAVDRMSQELDLEDVDRLELDHDTKSAPGMADISQTILEKISQCAVMVADVTPIAITDRGKALPNPNVMVELGYGLKSLGFERIIAILNTASGHRIEELPFDIRHRRILTYALSEAASKAERKVVRETLIKQLVVAIQTNIVDVRDARSAEKPIDGATCDPDSSGLWDAQWPVSHQGSFGEIAKVRPVTASRAWLRVIPETYPTGVPAISALDKLSGDSRLWAPVGGGNSGDSGSCAFGYVTYWVSGSDDVGTNIAHNLAAFLEETGEIWMSNGVAFTESKGQTFISYAHLLSNWARGLEQSMTCLDALGASRRRRVIIGVEGMADAVWPAQESYVPSRSRKPSMEFEATKRDWPNDQRLLFLQDGWNKLRDAFSLDPMDETDFARYYDIRRRN